MEKINNENKSDKKFHKLNKMERQEKQENGNVKENNNNISSYEKDYEENNQDEIKSKLLKILFGDKSKNKKEEENNNEKKEDEDTKKFYESSFDFHKTRLPKIKFRNNKELRTMNTDDNNEKKIFETEIKRNINDIEKINGGFNENINVNKGKKKIKKVIKKKVKKKKKDKMINEEEKTGVNYESAAERGVEEEVETSVQEERLAKSLQERKIDKNRMINSKENEQKGIKEEKGKIKDKNKEKRKEEDNIKEKTEYVKKLGKKEIVEKLVKYSDKKVLEDKSIPQKRKELNLLSDKDNVNNNNFINGKKEEKKQETKHNSLIKRERMTNAKLINNNSLNHKERIRRKQLEKDLEAEINKDELSDDPFDESDNEINNKEEEGFRSLSARTRKIAKKIEPNTTGKDESKNLYDSIIKRKKETNYNKFKKNRQFEKNIYTPKKAVLSRENSKTNTFLLNKDRNKKIIKNDNVFNSLFDSKEKEKATKFKLFNDNCIKKMNEANNYTNNLDNNQLSSIDLSSIINNSNTIGNEYNNGKNRLLYIKKSPGRNNNNYNNINQYNERNRANTLNTLAIMSNYRENNVNNYKKSNLKKMLIRNYNNRNDEDVTLTEQNESYQDNEDNSGIINESNDEPMSNTFYINTRNVFNIKKNTQVNSHNNNNNSFTFRKHIKILNPLPSV